MSGSAAKRAQARGDGFDEERKRLFTVGLREGFRVLEACRLVGVSNRTAYNHRRSDPDFARDWALALRMSRLPLELVAFERAVDGVKEPVYAYGRLSHVRVRRSDGLLAALLAAEHPGKYGRSAGARAQGRLQKRIKRLAARIEALEARFEQKEMLTVRNDRAVNLVNPAASFRAPAPPRARGGRKPLGWRLAAARRRSSDWGIPVSPMQS